METSFYQHAKEVILPFWCQDSLRDPRGGFFSTADAQGQVIPTDKRGCVQHARLLWSFSEAYLCFGESIYLELARHAFKYLVKAHWDQLHGGWYFYTDDSGGIRDERKHLYAQSFALYGLCSYFRASSDVQACTLAEQTFGLIIKHGKDSEYGGFHESFTREWKKCEQIEEFGMSGNYKTMNSHIHILEAFTAYRELGAPIDEELKSVMDVIIDKIWRDENSSLGLYFSRNWKSLKNVTSYGHDIETSWLLIKASKAAELYRMDDICDIQRQVLDQVKGAMGPSGLVYNDWDRDHAQMDKTFYWWVQAEALVGLAYGGEWASFNKVWEGVQELLVDRIHGEWFETPELRERKIYEWKTPYHHLRAALEVAKAKGERH